MAGMRALGRLYDVVTSDAAANTLKVNMKNCSGVGVLAVCTTTASSTLTATAAKTYGGSYVAAGISTFPATMYSRASAGTAAWSDDSSGISWVTSTGVGTIAGATATDAYYLEFLATDLAADYTCLEIVASADLWVTLIAHDLSVQRTPPNLVAIAS